ncbi:acyl-CoA dehydrogenase family protein [Roseomonas sp. BN140053]|uniref:acyl-CoA dehydrogenase family protein n=1 Tax=Roseomonas sp. BN140053 TaxID=3391898 RepID=UPI0039E83576
MNHLSPLPVPGHASTLDALRDLLPTLLAETAALDRSDEQPEAAVAALHRAGLLQAPLPRDLGGLGWGNEAAAAPALRDALRLLGRASLPLGRLWEGHVNALRLVAEYGTPEQRETAAADCAAGRLFGVWNSGDPAGLHLDPLDGAAEPARFRLRGRKIYCSGAGLVERALVTATAAGAPPRMLLVPLPRDTDRADLSDWAPTGMGPSRTGTVEFTGLTLGQEAVLGEPGDYLRQPGFSGGAWRFLAVQLGGLEALAEALRAHLNRTGRGGDAHQQGRLGSVLTAAETARLWVVSAAAVAEGGDRPTEEVVAYVNLARGAVERAALDVLELVQRSVGLPAFLSPNPIERMARDLATYLRQPFPDGALCSAAAFGLGMARPVGDQWGDPTGS